MMTDRELWAMVFCKALEVGETGSINGQELVSIEGHRLTLTEWSRKVADQAIKDAPEDKP